MSATWIPAHKALVGDRSPRPAEVETRERVHQLCRDWRDRGLPLGIVRQECSGFERWTATRFTAPSHAMYWPLMAMLDALIATEDGDHGMQYATPQGTFSTADLRAAGADITKPGRRIRIDLPIRWPWRRKPNPDRGDPGERGDPIYARTYEERQRIANTREGGEPKRTRTFE